MKTKLFPVALAALTLLAITGCSRGDDQDAVTPTIPATTAVPASAPTTTATPTTVAAPAAAVSGFAAKVGESDLGTLMTSADGLTLYGFIDDVNATSTCYASCAEAWPPVIVADDWQVGPGLDTATFATTERDDGTLQLVAGKFPLYTYGGDATPGDTTGHGSGDVWFAMNLDGTLIAADAGPAAHEPDAAATPTTTVASEPTRTAAPVAVAETSLGDVIVDADGMTLYGFTNDATGEPTCNDKCADAWPPVIVESEELPAGLDATLYSVVERADGTFQLEAGTWPLYRFVGDAAAGDVNGQGSGGAWFVLDPTAMLVK